MLYSDGVQMPSKVAINPDEPSLGRIRADYVTPPHTLTSFKQYLSRVERNAKLVHIANILEDPCDTPLKEGHISFRTDGPGLSSDEPMAVVLPPYPGPDGRYMIKNRAADIYWSANDNPIRKVLFYLTTMEDARKDDHLQATGESLIIQVFRG